MPLTVIIIIKIIIIYFLQWWELQSVTDKTAPSINGRIVQNSEKNWECLFLISVAELQFKLEYEEIVFKIKNKNNFHFK